MPSRPLSSFLARETTQWPVTQGRDVSGRPALREAGVVAGGHGSLAARQPAQLASTGTCRSAAPDTQPRHAPHVRVRNLLTSQWGGVRWESGPPGAQAPASCSVPETQGSGRVLRRRALSLCHLGTPGRTCHGTAAGRW